MKRRVSAIWILYSLLLYLVYAVYTLVFSRERLWVIGLVIVPVVIISVRRVIGWYFGRRVGAAGMLFFVVR